MSCSKKKCYLHGRLLKKNKCLICTEIAPKKKCQSAREDCSKKNKFYLHVNLVVTQKGCTKPTLADIVKI